MEVLPISIIMKKIKPFLLVCILYLSSCTNLDNRSRVEEVIPEFKYKIRYGFGNVTVSDYSIGDIIYLSGGRITYLSYNSGNPDSVIIGGTYCIKKYK